MAEKAEQGIWPGAAPLGYRNTARGDGKRIIEVDPEVGPLISRLFTTYAQGGISMLALSKEAESWGLVGPKTRKRLAVPTLHYTLTNLLYTGEFTWNGRVYKGIHAPLVSRELWDRVQERLSSRAVTSARDRKREFLFTGLVRCGVCADEGQEARLLIGEIQKGKYVYYHCDGCRLKKRAVYLREAVLEGELRRLLRALYIDPATLAYVREALRSSHEDQRQHHVAALERLHKQYLALQQRVEVAYEDRLDGRISADLFERKSAEWRAEQGRIRREMARHEAADRVYIEEGLALLELSSRALELYDQQPTDERRRLLHFVLLNCTWRPDNLEVAWRKPFDKFAECARPVAENESASTTAGTGFKSELHKTARTRTHTAVDSPLRITLVRRVSLLRPPPQARKQKNRDTRRPQGVLARALDLQARIGRGGIHTRADLAAALGVSRARVTQMLAVLAVPGPVMDILRRAEAAGRPVTEGGWRKVKGLPADEAVRRLRELGYA